MNKHKVSFEVFALDRCELNRVLSEFMWNLCEADREVDPNSLRIEGPDCAASCCVDEEKR